MELGCPHNYNYPLKLSPHLVHFKLVFKLVFNSFEERPFVFQPLIRIPNVSSHYENANESFLEPFYNSSCSTTIIGVHIFHEKDAMI